MSPPAKAGRPPVEFAAQRFKDRSDWWLGHDQGNRPALLVPDATTDPSPDLETVDLVVLRSRRCVIVGPDGAQGTFTVLVCRSERDNVRDYFRDLCSDLEAWSRKDPSRSVSELVLQLVHFFRQLQVPARKSEQGIWGELLLIAASSDRQRLVRAWHSSASDLFDFSSGSQRIEVKTSQSEERVHHFLLAQLHDPLVEVCVLSLVVQVSADGFTIQQLMDEITSDDDLEPEDILRVRRIVAETLGSDWLRAAREAYDRRRAAATAKFIRAGEIPSVSPQLPWGVSRVGFFSDVSNAEPLSRVALQSAGGLWALSAPLSSIN